MSADSPTLTGPVIPPLSGDRPKKLVVFLHGLGADGQDLISLGQVFGQIMPDVQFASPDAPQPCDMAPFGYQWFSLQDRGYSAMLAGVEQAAPILNAFLDRQLEILGLTDEDLALVGFSQGTMMALYAALRRPDCCAGIVGYSGALVAPETLGAEIASRPPVCLIHGDADPVVTYEAMAAAEAGLKTAGISVETHTRTGLGHGIDPEGITIAGEFLKRCLKV